MTFKYRTIVHRTSYIKNYVLQKKYERYYDLSEHNTEFNNGWYTYTKRPVILKYYETTNDIKQAILRDKQLKGLGKKKKEALYSLIKKRKTNTCSRQ